MSIRRVAVIDIGKTNAKVALVDLQAMAETGVAKTPNTVLPGPPYPHFDIPALWDFILSGLASLNRETPIDAISVTTHGATAALLDAQGELALPVLDYEFDGPDSLSEAYDGQRPPFAETGTPRLPIGLNLGAQLFWQQERFPDAFARTASILTYPQYWAFQLTGVRANEASSLGCHTDLWAPARADFSALVDKRGWRSRMAPVRRADAVLGPVLPEIAEATGIAPTTPVFCGIHDSNASLLPHLLGRKGAFSVVSTGTWVISMAVEGRGVTLDEARDTLINVNAFGDPVPSARFMGGRAFERELGPDPAPPAPADLERVLAERIMLLPSVNPGSGPFPDRIARWAGTRPRSEGEHHAAMSFYLALMTATCLDLIGADGPVIVEGPFANNLPLLDMLALVTGRAVEVGQKSATGTSIGAALLASDGVATAMEKTRRHTSRLGETARVYAQDWFEATKS